MKILVISHMYPSPSNASDGVVVLQLAKELQRLGCEVRVVSPRPAAPFPLRYVCARWGAAWHLPSTMWWDGTQVQYPRYLAFPGPMFISPLEERMHLGIRKMVAEIHRDFEFDIVHAHMALPDGFAAMLVADAYKKPLITTPQVTDTDINLLRSRKSFDAVCAVLRRSAVVISPSPSIGAKLEQKTGIATETIPYGIYPGTVFTGESELPRKYSGRSILLSISRLIPTKGLELNIQAVAKLRQKHPSLHYLIAGEGTLRRDLVYLARDLDITDSVEFIGHLPHDTAMEYMSMCDVFSLPSWRETLGLVYLEAMAHGKPIIGCRGQGVDGLTIDGETGWMVKPRDLESLVQAIDSLLSNPEGSREMGERGRGLVLGNYTWEAIAARHIDVYKKAVATNG